MKDSNQRRAMSLVLATLAFGACSRGSKTDHRSEAPVWANVTIRVDNPAEAKGLKLAAADSYSGVISGCVSGYSKALTKADTTVNVQDGDFNCLFKLSSLAYGGETFSFDGTENWASGGAFNKTGSSGTAMNFSVVSQLASPVAGAQAVTLIFGAADEGANQAVAADITTAVSITGVDPLGVSLTIADVKVQNPSGAGLFSFDLACDHAVVGTGASAVCNGQTLQNLAIRLATDASFPNDLTLAECRAAATGTGTLHGVYAPAVGVNGGMQALSVPGPTKLFTPANAHLLLAVSGVGSSAGCSYWRIAVTAP